MFMYLYPVIFRALYRRTQWVRWATECTVAGRLPCWPIRGRGNPTHKISQWERKAEREREAKLHMKRQQQETATAAPPRPLPQTLPCPLISVYSTQAINKMYSTIFNTFFKRNSVYVTSVFAGAFAFQAFFDAGVTSWYENRNKGKLWKDVKLTLGGGDDEEEDDDE